VLPVNRLNLPQRCRLYRNIVIRDYYSINIKVNVGWSTAIGTRNFPPHYVPLYLAEWGARRSKDETGCGFGSRCLCASAAPDGTFMPRMLSLPGCFTPYYSTTTVWVLMYGTTSQGRVLNPSARPKVLNSGGQAFLPVRQTGMSVVQRLFVWHDLQVVPPAQVIKFGEYKLR